ncbi:hypothetical protein K503DRAFT_459845 [Rhizopogon vinicolor AM-OR11-026]|uniref:Uncharacterized protein n=1 Tax=Rhizopogon vinicolor AM-OR11-026 TaxID=1314800 RepID=A0A1B7MNS7_9AGAM|nr:hypothetical protein K503DRAFT_459845 [Rhizopogon vinicolor AM-OR11-026]
MQSSVLVGLWFMGRLVGGPYWLEAARLGVAGDLTRAKLLEITSGRERLKPVSPARGLQALN